MEISAIRKDYSLKSLDVTDVNASPIEQFRVWMEEAIKAELLEPTAMTLATASKEGIPTARIVLLKGFDEKGFTFFTNYNSEKGQQMLENPNACLNFHWIELERQVRILGTVEKVSPQESDEYFKSRPKGSRLGAWASPQSQIIPNREAISEELAKSTSKYENDEIPRPPHWGGYRVAPTKIEFWQGRPSRLHDRVCYTIDNEQWNISRLAP